jgi:hypothetical protein
MRFKRTPQTPRRYASPSASSSNAKGRPVGSARSRSSFGCGRGDGRDRSIDAALTRDDPGAR